MTIIPEIGELWEYHSGGQHLCVLIVDVAPFVQGKDGVNIRCINLINEGFSRSDDTWWFSTETHARDLWQRLA
jgi:hypothetical protein